jgi:predicted ATP-dependent serine protease
MVKKPEDYVEIVQQYNFKCTKCGTRHPTKQNRCFVCGGIDTIQLDQIKVKIKKKRPKGGATVKINI